MILARRWVVVGLILPLMGRGIHRTAGVVRGGAPPKGPRRARRMTAGHLTRGGQMRSRAGDAVAGSTASSTAELAVRLSKVVAGGGDGWGEVEGCHCRVAPVIIRIDILLLCQYVLASSVPRRLEVYLRDERWKCNAC